MVSHTFELEKLLKCHLRGKTCRKWANRLKICESEKKGSQGLFCPHPGVGIHVYYNNIQRSSLKPLGQSKPNEASIGKGN